MRFEDPREVRYAAIELTLVSIDKSSIDTASEQTTQVLIDRAAALEDFILNGKKVKLRA